jgi:hypothetical protein
MDYYYPYEYIHILKIHYKVYLISAETIPDAQGVIR